ncbi:MAG: hypothetical protein ATN36_01560 [Epulopiscium sp. Nele67-Bin005]|nr:MAG: hypothetical protein ATN36_01560 [Epulopiscium sp. Nele67-Bin005]
MLELSSKQPKDQKNGIKIYRIDGKYLYGEQVINFEVQIKSLVNIFWSEIEHKVIYKNYNYIISDRFYKDIMRSIKNSLTTIDQQLLLISNQFERSKNTAQDGRKLQVETLLSKVIYDLFAERMKKDIGFLVDFRKSCDTLVKYVFRETAGCEIANYNYILIETLNRLTEIDEETISFNSQLTFERELNFDDDFCIIVGTHITNVINKEFQWNLFFKILFYLEPENNAGDFEKFIDFYKHRICSDININRLALKYGETLAKEIMEELLLQFAKTFVQINLVDLFYDNMIESLKRIMNYAVLATYKNVHSKADWKKFKHIYINLLEFRMLSMLNLQIDPHSIMKFLEEIRVHELDIEVHKSLVKYISTI